MEEKHYTDTVSGTKNLPYHFPQKETGKWQIVRSYWGWIYC